jgi:carboxylesterase type B
MEQTLQGDWIDQKILGTYHASELPFVFGNAWPALVHAFSVKDQTLSNSFQYYWTNFAKTLNPNGGVTTSMNGTAELFWPQFSGQLQNLVLDVPASVQIRLYQSQCDFWDQYPA